MKSNNETVITFDEEKDAKALSEIYKRMKKERGGNIKAATITYKDKVIVAGEKSELNGDNAVVSEELFLFLVELSSSTYSLDIPETIGEDLKIILAWLDKMPITWNNSVVFQPDKIGVPEGTLIYDAGNTETPPSSDDPKIECTLTLGGMTVKRSFELEDLNPVENTDYVDDENQKIECTLTLGGITVKRLFDPSIFNGESVDPVENTDSLDDEQGTKVESPYAIRYKHHFISQEFTTVSQIVSKDLFNMLLELSLYNQPIAVKYRMVEEMQRFIESIGEDVNEWFIGIDSKGVKVVFPASTTILSREEMLTIANKGQENE